MDKNRFEERKKIILDIINSPNYVPMKIKEMAILLNVPKENREDLALVLNALVEEGKIGVNKKGKYGKVSNNLKIGTFVGNQRGFGFVLIEGEEDVFIPESKIHGAVHDDTVQVAVHSSAKKPEGKRREGEIVRVISHGKDEIVGLFRKSKTYGFVEPDNLKFNKDIYVSENDSMGAVTGHKVVVKIKDYGSDDRKPEGVITEIIGHINDPGTDIISIVRAYDIPMEYPEGVMNQVSLVPDEVSEEEKAGRLDLRDWQTVTIDGEDAKDLDDAITLSKEGDIYKLGVHIADVSHYVTEHSPLDKEALKRGTSVYLVDRVIPMLPHKLSNGICSLNEGCDRLALSCIMEIDKKGNVIGHQIAETLINVDRRMSYTSVKKIITDKDEEETLKYKELVPMFFLMEEVAGILREKRRKRGSIDFDFPESKIYLDAKGEPIDIKPYERNAATRIIEDFMLAANETVAEDFFWQELPFVYRTHENPDSEKMLKLCTFINNFGYDIKVGEDIHPKEIQKLIDKIADTPEEALISRLTLRSMKRAAYTTQCTGHFGLAAKYYCHFTSPIRRYPDLQIHRIIKENLKGGLGEKRENHYSRILNEVALNCSITERRADDAERDVEKLKKVQYMKKFIGEEFEGVISGMSAYGMYVELPNTVEGMVHITTFKDDYYYYDEESYALIGEATHHTYKLGEKVKIKVTGVDKIQRTIDFELAEDGNEDE
ncbi:MAG: ribonuclease R [Lachnospiraceae bacterium]|nr:ribonuclease R [Lachnospiraceae bacterium]